MQDGRPSAVGLALLVALSVVSVSAEPTQLLVLTDTRESRMPPGGYELYANGYVHFKRCPEPAEYKVVNKAAYEACDVDFPSTYYNLHYCGGDEMHVSVPQAVGGKHPWEGHAHEGVLPNSTVYMIATVKDLCNRGRRFFIRVFQNPACFASCCPGAAELCFFRRGFEPTQNCEIIRQVYPNVGMACDDGNPETSGEKCTRRAACLGHRSITAFFLQSELSNYTNSLGLTTEGQEAIASAMKQRIGATEDVTIASANFSSGQVEVTLEIPDENVGLAELQLWLFLGNVAVIGNRAVTISSTPIVITTTTTTPATTSGAATSNVTTTEAAALTATNVSAGTTAQPGNSSEAGRSAGFSWSTKKTGITVGVVFGVVVAAIAIIVFVKFAGPGRMQPRVSSADITTSSTPGKAANAYDYGAHMTPNPAFKASDPDDGIVTKLSISLPVEDDTHVYDSVA